MSHFEFFQQSIKNLKTIGTFTRTSKYACKSLTAQLDFSSIDLMVELGGGDGAITLHILKNLKPNAKLIVFEVNELFCNKLKIIKDKRLIIVRDSAENLENYLKTQEIDKVDAILSAIPFMLIPEEISFRILQTCKNVLKPSARFLQIHYSLTRKKMYEAIFGNIKLVFVPINFPPLFIFVCIKKPALAFAHIPNTSLGIRKEK